MENTTMTPEELLVQVNNAITAVLVGGQSYKIGSRQLTRADLEAQVAQSASSHLLDRTYVAYFDGR